MADFFADLLPNKQPQNGGGPKLPGLSEDDVLVSPKAGSSGSEAGSASRAAQMAGGPMVSTRGSWVAGRYTAQAPGAAATPGPLSISRSLHCLQRKDSSKDLEGAVQQVFQRFSGSLQKILEDIDRCGAWPGGRHWPQR